MRSAIYYSVASIFSLFFFFCPAIAKANENFATSFDSTYTVSENGNTHAVYKITLTNASSLSYATIYKINLGFNNIENISASDSLGKINVMAQKTAKGYSLSLPFNQKIVGKRKSLAFTLTFDTNTIAQKQGSIWEINIPKITNQNTYTAFNVHAIVPKSFGTPTYVKPEIRGETLDFTKDQLKDSGISIAFGENQYYSFTLKYHLKNASLFPAKTEIAIPSTTNYQEITIDDITPKPENIVSDVDGNWLAEYSLSPSKKIDIVVHGKARISLIPKKEILTNEEIALYTKEELYWQQNKKIKDTAKNLRTPRAIYNYVVNNLSYDFSRITAYSSRLGALSVLENPSSAVCLEFTDLFIALARANGIPAREADGFAYTKNQMQRPLSLVKDILHAWPEYYDFDQQAWVMVDPTWENTTGGVDYFDVLDFDHLAFVIRGQKSTYPFPAGDYKISGSNDTKDIEVSFANSFADRIPKIESSLYFPNKAFSGFPITGTITLKNIENIPFPEQEILVTSPDLMPNTQKVYSKTIPPFGSVTIPVSLHSSSILTNITSTVTIQIDKSHISRDIQIQPIFKSKEGIVGGILIAIFIIFLSIFTKRVWGLPFSRRKG